MELRQLRYLIAISEEQNINRAAKLCFVTQPALTQQIKKLEDEFNTSILIRRGRGIILSEDGNRLSEYAKDVIKKVDVINNEFSQSRIKRNKQVSLGIIPSVYKLITTVKKSELSSLNIKLKKMCDEQMEYELRRGLVNGGITSSIPNIENTYVTTVAREKMYVIASRNHFVNLSSNVDIKSLESEPLALLSKEAIQRDYIDKYLKENDLNIKVKLDVDSFNELINIVKYSNFISILPYSLVSTFHDDDICKVEVINHDFCRELYLILDEDNKDNNKFNFINSCFTELTQTLN